MKIVLIGGKQGSGKTTTADELAKRLVHYGHFVNRLKFADVIYEMHAACLRILNSYGITTKPKEGLLLQLLGTEFGRQYLGEDVWIKALRNRVEKIKMSYKKDESKLIIIVDDLRFENEFDAFDDALRVLLV